MAANAAKVILVLDYEFMKSHAGDMRA